MKYSEILREIALQLNVSISEVYSVVVQGERIAGGLGIVILVVFFIFVVHVTKSLRRLLLRSAELDEGAISFTAVTLATICGILFSLFLYNTTLKVLVPEYVIIRNILFRFL